MIIDELPLDGDNALLDVVVFPQAFTTLQNYEAQLLTIIHFISAPNGASCSGGRLHCQRIIVFFHPPLFMMDKFIILKNLMACSLVGLPRYWWIFTSLSFSLELC